MTNIMALKDRGQNALYLENKSLAESCFQKALAIAEELAHEHPDWPVTSIRLAEVLTTFSEARSKMGQYEKAADLDRRALEAWNRLAEEHPNRPTFRRAAEKVRLRVNDSERAKMKKP
jgi:tetratricopeptide (TPR) repeat protein